MNKASNIPFSLALCFFLSHLGRYKRPPSSPPLRYYSSKQPQNKTKSSLTTCPLSLKAKTKKKKLSKNQKNKQIGAKCSILSLQVQFSSQSTIFSPILLAEKKLMKIRFLLYFCVLLPINEFIKATWLF